MSLPDRLVHTRGRRARLTPAARAHLGRIASAVVWRALHPTARGPFVERPAPAAARRLYYRTADGWRAPVLRIEPTAGPWPHAAGEPVLLAHGLTGGPDLFRYGATPLVDALREAGFAVYLWTHRGDRHAIPPEGRVDRTASPEILVERDLPAALAAVAEHSRFQRVHLVGHGLGGVLAIAAGARREPLLASVVALGAPLELPDVRADGRLAARLLSLLPSGWPVPVRAVSRLVAPLVGGTAAGQELARHTPSARMRGALWYAMEDPPVALVRSVRAWLRTGSPALYGGALELCEGIAAAEVPLFVVTGTDDPVCPPEAGERALARWGHPDRTAIRAPGSHLDLVLGQEAPTTVFAPIVEWLGERRRRSWVASA